MKGPKKQQDEGGKREVKTEETDGIVDREVKREDKDERKENRTHTHTHTHKCEYTNQSLAQNTYTKQAATLHIQSSRTD